VSLNWNGEVTESILLAHGTSKFIDNVCRNIEERVAELADSGNITDHILELVTTFNGT
jgi:hypothetical protein